MRPVGRADECPSCGLRYEWDVLALSEAEEPVGAAMTALDVFRSERAGLDPR